MSNAQIAADFCSTVKARLKTGGVWTSDNLPHLSREDRRAILAVYKRNFKYVDYNSKTGVCRCSDFPITQQPLSGNILVMGDTGGDFGKPVDLNKVDFDKNSTLFVVV